MGQQSPPSPRSQATEMGLEPTFRGIDNIAVELPLAGIGSRCLAAFIDYVLLYVVLMVFFVSLIFLAAVTSGQDEGIGTAVIVIIIVGVFLIQWLYFLLQEIFMGGQTLGKKAVRLRVIGRHAGAATTMQYVIRNLLRPVDLILGIPFMFIDSQSRRLGDRAAGTMVLHDRPAAKDEATLTRIPKGWGLSHIAVAESLLRRGRDMDPSQFQHLALRMVHLIEKDDAALLKEAPDPEIHPVAALRHALGVIVETDVPLEPGAPEESEATLESKA